MNKKYIIDIKFKSPDLKWNLMDYYGKHILWERIVWISNKSYMDIGKVKLKLTKMK